MIKDLKERYVPSKDIRATTTIKHVYMINAGVLST